MHINSAVSINNTKEIVLFKKLKFVFLTETTVAPPIPTTITTAAPTTAPTTAPTGRCLSKRLHNYDNLITICRTKSNTLN